MKKVIRRLSKQEKKEAKWCLGKKKNMHKQDKETVNKQDINNTEKIKQYKVTK